MANLERITYRPQFADRTYEQILEENLLKVPKNIDKREGSIVYDAIAPMALEVSMLYQYIDFLYKNAFASTANRYWLIERAKERGITPYEASKSTIVGKFNRKIDQGEKFIIDGKYFIITEFLEERDKLFFYLLQSEGVGRDQNIEGGTLTPIGRINNLKISEVHKLAIPGENAEATEDFRERYFETIKFNAYGGNIDDYKYKTKAIEGVGGVKVIPVWNGGGTVKLIIVDSENNSPTEELIKDVQEKIDPIPYKQKGVGIAPIGHYVTVVGAKKTNIDINVKILIDKEYQKSDIQENIKLELEEYFKIMRSNWEKYDSGEYFENDIRLTKILSIILNIDGVIDYEGISFNDNSRIYKLEDEEIPYLGNLKVEFI